MSTPSGAEPGADAALIGADRRLIYPLLASATAVFAVQLDFFAMQAGVEQMAFDLGTSATSLQWVLTGYMVAAASFLIVGGRLGDIFGRRRWLIIGASIFGLTSVVAGAASDAGLVVLMRVVQGVGAAVMFPTALAVTTNAFPTKKIQRAVGLVLGIGAIGQAFGPLIGGLLTDLLSWRALFWVNIPIVLLLIFFARRGVSESRDESVPRSIDWVGATLIAASTAAFMLGIVRAGEWGLDDLRTVALIAAGLIGYVIFAIVEGIVRFPILDMSLFRIRTFSVVTIGGSLGTSSATIIVFLSMLFFQNVEGMSPVEAGLALITFSVAYAVAALASGRFEMVEPWKVMSTALLVGGAGTVGLGLSGDLLIFSVFGLVAGLGLGLAFSYLNVISQAVVPARVAGAASGTALTILVIAGAVALAIAVAVFETATEGTDYSAGGVIHAILIGAGLVSIASGALVAVLGRAPSVEAMGLRG